MAEAYYVPVSPHNAMGPLQIAAGSQAMLTVPNAYRLEHSTASIPRYNEYLKEPLAFDGSVLRVGERPGLGVEVDREAVAENLHPDWEQKR